MRSTLPTINRAVDEGAKVGPRSHLGRPDGKFNPKSGAFAPGSQEASATSRQGSHFCARLHWSGRQLLVSKMKPGA
ncbi:MAG: hypothetical protein U0361_19135 [Nitrospiraceae bacterium]